MLRPLDERDPDTARFTISRRLRVNFPHVRERSTITQPSRTGSASVAPVMTGADCVKWDVMPVCNPDNSGDFSLRARLQGRRYVLPPRRGNSRDNARARRRSTPKPAAGSYSTPPMPTSCTGNSAFGLAAPGRPFSELRPLRLLCERPASRCDSLSVEGI